MRAVVENEHGDFHVLAVTDEPVPELEPGQVLIKVAAAGINRADVMQRRGLYPPPSGASNVFGLEAAGTVEKVADGVDSALVGQERVALLAGGGYAEYVAVDADHTLPVPKGVSIEEAAGLIEVAATVYSNLVTTCGMSTELAENQGKTALVHGGTGGIGQHAIQFLQNMGVKVFTTAGTPEKCAFLQSQGAEAINYRAQDFEQAIKEQAPEGVDYILDVVGAKYLKQNLNTLKTGGHLTIIGLQGGAEAEIDLRQMLSRRLNLHATSLRSRPAQEKKEILAGVEKTVWPLVEKGLIKPNLGKTFPLEEVAAAHEYFDSGEHTGKVVLTLS